MAHAEGPGNGSSVMGATVGQAAPASLKPSGARSGLHCHLTSKAARVDQKRGPCLLRAGKLT